MKKHIIALALTVISMVSGAEERTVSAGWTKGEGVVVSEEEAECGAGTEGEAGTKGEAARWAVVELSSIYMRIAPDYESALETQELMGTIVEIKGEKGYWREVVSPQPYKAWCTEKGIVEMSQEELEAYKAAPKCMFADLYGHLYEEPSFQSATICDLVGGDVMRLAPAGQCRKRCDNDSKTGRLIHDVSNLPCGSQGHYRPANGEFEQNIKDSGLTVKGSKKKGWTKVLLPSGKEGWVSTAQIRPHEGFFSIAKGEGDEQTLTDRQMEGIIAKAFTLRGVPYLWGGMTPKGVDCSGLVRWSFIMNGIVIPRNASQIIHCGDEVSLDAMQRGDLVFFGTPAKDGKPQRVTHIGIYLGDGRIIHSSHMVRVNSLNPEDADYYENAHRLIAARRL